MFLLHSYREGQIGTIGRTSTYSTAADAVDRMTLEMANLRSERDAALSEVGHLKMMLQTSQMSPESVKNNDRGCMSLTGLTYQTFERVASLMLTFIAPVIKFWVCYYY